MRTIRLCLAIMALLTLAQTASAQMSRILGRTVPAPDIDTIALIDNKLPQQIYQSIIDRPDFDSIISNPSRHYKVANIGRPGPLVFSTYKFLPKHELTNPERDSNFADAYVWLDDLSSTENAYQRAIQDLMMYNPDAIEYNADNLPVAPKLYRAFVDPSSLRIEFEEAKVTEKPQGPETERKKWLHRFDASLQFSQAYVSPNWYQGGNNNLNMIGQLIYNLKLNQKFYPNYLLDITAQYKIGLNSTPDDSIRAYNISEDLFQFNLTAGLKAYKKWYYSANVNFKTQIFNHYPSNSHNLTSALLSPGELNVGLGMTYNSTNKNKTFTIDLSVSPISWNLKTCINHNLNETAFGIKEGRNSVSEIGSSLECKYQWKMAWNITYKSRIFLFSDYSYLQGDWEHTFNFAINRYFSTQLYLHMRYDTSTPRIEDSKWHKFQFKEILSFGFNYVFSTI